jgi:hypothetical protein
MIKDIELDMENELLSELLELAFREAEEQKWKRSRRRTSHLSKRGKQRGLSRQTEAAQINSTVILLKKWA